MAEAFFNALTGGEAVAVSAGTRPEVLIDQNVVEAMRETGIDIRNQTPKLLTLEMMDKADRVVTMGCNVAETCPTSFVPTEDWELNDPAGKSLDEVREIRNSVKAKVEVLVKEFSL
jgi:arsenate reductase